MKQQFFIPERLPGLNEIIGARLRYYTIKAKSGRKIRISQYDNLKKRVENAIACYINQAGIKPMGCVNASFLWLESNRKRDKDNISTGKEFIFDTLVAMKILKNDGWQHVNQLSDVFEVDKVKPGVMVTLSEFGGEYGKGRQQQKEKKLNQLIDSLTILLMNIKGKGLGDQDKKEKKDKKPHLN